MQQTFDRFKLKPKAPIALAGVLAALVLAWAFRFQTVPTTRMTGYLVNRWTGTVYWLTPSGVREVVERDARNSP